MTSTSTSKSQCNARVAVWASECGFCPPEDYYTVAIQCEKSADGDDCLCKIHTKNLPFGTFGKKAPKETLTKCSIGKGDSKFNFKAGEPSCWLFKKPDGVIGEDGTLKVITKSVKLDNEFWQTEDDGDYSDDENPDYSDSDYSGSDSASSDGGGSDYSDSDSDSVSDSVSDSGTTDYKTLKIKDLKADLKQRGIKTSGKKEEIIERLKKHDSDPDSFKTKKRKSDKTRKPSIYNLFMSKQIPIYKTANPDTDHKSAFLACAAAWKTADDNPKTK